jgi:hypothetical protein
MSGVAFSRNTDVTLPHDQDQGRKKKKNKPREHQYQSSALPGTTMKGQLDTRNTFHDRTFCDNDDTRGNVHVPVSSSPSSHTAREVE